MALAVLAGAVFAVRSRGGQLRFINLVVEHLTANGAMEVARLYDAPFTDTAPHGPDMIFTDHEVDGIVAILDEARQHALPEITVA